MTEKEPSEIGCEFNAILRYSNRDELQNFILRFETDESLHYGCISYHDVNLLFADFKSCFKFIMAAGGWVKNCFNQILVIHRLGVWDLPKGKCEEGETPDITALREVEEECGISHLVIEKHLCNTYHTYREKNSLVLKETFWYQMTTSDISIPQPQTEEAITLAEWMDSERMNVVKKNSYASILDVIHCALH